MTEFAGFLLLGMAGLNYTLRRDVAYPPFLFTALWCVILFLHSVLEQIWSFEIQPLSNTVLLVFTVGALFFTLGGLATHYYYDARAQAQQRPSLTLWLHPWFDQALFWLPFLALPLFCLEALSLTGTSTSTPFFESLRYQLTVGGRDYGLLDYTIPVVIFNTWLRFWQKEIQPDDTLTRRRFYIALAVNLVLLVLTTGRTYFMLLFALLIGFRILSGKPVIRMALYSGISFLSLFAAFSFAKGFVQEETWAQVLLAVSRRLIWYAVGSLRALDHFLHKPYDLLNGDLTLRFFDALAFRLGLTDTEPAALVQPDVLVPDRTNVYTVYYTYIQDFGILASFLFIGVFAIVHGVLYFRSRSGSLSARYAYALMLYPLLMSFFQDQYLSLLSTWIQYLLLYGIAFTLFIKVYPDPESKSGRDRFV